MNTVIYYLKPSKSPPVLVGKENPSPLSGLPTAPQGSGEGIPHSLGALSHNLVISRATSSFEAHQCSPSVTQGAVLSCPMRQKFQEVTEGLDSRSLWEPEGFLCTKLWVRLSHHPCIFWVSCFPRSSLVELSSQRPSLASCLAKI